MSKRIKNSKKIISDLKPWAEKEGCQDGLQKLIDSEQSVYKNAFEKLTPDFLERLWDAIPQYCRPKGRNASDLRPLLEEMIIEAREDSIPEGEAKVVLVPLQKKIADLKEELAKLDGVGTHKRPLYDQIGDTPQLVARTALRKAAEKTAEGNSLCEKAYPPHYFKDRQHMDYGGIICMEMHCRPWIDWLEHTTNLAISALEEQSTKKRKPDDEAKRFVIAAAAAFKKYTGREHTIRRSGNQYNGNALSFIQTVLIEFGYNREPSTIHADFKRVLSFEN